MSIDLLIYCLSDGPSYLGLAMLDGSTFWPPVKYFSVWPFSFLVEVFLPSIISVAIYKIS